MDYLTEPQEIERRSMEIIDDLFPEPRSHEGLDWLVVRRMVHTSADLEMPSLVRFSPGAALAGAKALSQGALIYTDTMMALSGIPVRRLGPLGCEVRCLIGDPQVARAARENGVTRSMAAVDVAVQTAPEAIFVIGNAPTALLRLIEHMRAGRAAPALVVGMPVGFVNAAESKALLVETAGVTPFIVIEGRKGGSALAASCINALADQALADRGLSSEGA